MPALGTITSTTNVRSSNTSTPTPGTTVTVTVTTGVNHYASWTAAQNETLNCSGTQEVGQRLVIKITNDLTPRTITFGTGFGTTTALVGTASTFAVLEFISDGSKFYQLTRLTALT
jgi:hypothetical protein